MASTETGEPGMGKPQEMQQIGHQSPAAPVMANVADAKPEGNHVVPTIERQSDLKPLIAEEEPRKFTPKPRVEEKPAPRTIDAEDLDRLQEEHSGLKKALSEMRKDLKAATRENREQSLELRDLKRQNTLLREAYTNAQNEVAHDQRKMSKAERNKYIEHYEMLEEHATYFQRELHKREAHLEYLTKQAREANESKGGLEADNRKLQRQIRDLSANLTECKDDLLRLQPVGQVSDSEIADQYSNLCQQIAGWVDDQTEDPERLEEYFNNLKSVDDMPEAVRPYLRNRHLKFAKQFPECLPNLLQYLLNCFIQQHILGNEIYLFALHSRHVTLLQQAEQGMKSLEPKRDNVTLRRWRSETLQGLLKMSDSTAEQTEQGKSLAQLLFSALSGFYSDAAEDDEGWEMLYEEVLRPAVRLANAIRVSISDYRLITHLFTKASDQQYTLLRNEIQHYEMIDNTTHKIIRPDSILKVADDGRIGEEMFVISPALLRSQKDNASVILCKPTVLVKLDEPMGKRERKAKPLVSWPGWFGGDPEEKEE